MVASGDVKEDGGEAMKGQYVGVQEPLGVACYGAGLGAGAAMSSGSEHYHAAMVCGSGIWTDTKISSKQQKP